MNIEIADVVVPLNGRDAGKSFVVIGKQDDYSLLADGKCRRVEKPKRKKSKHVRRENGISGPIAEKLLEGEKVTNSEIRRVLTDVTHGVKGGM